MRHNQNPHKSADRIVRRRRRRVAGDEPIRFLFHSAQSLHIDLMRERDSERQNNNIGNFFYVSQFAGKNKEDYAE